MITVNNLDVQFGKRILFQDVNMKFTPVSYTPIRAHETKANLVCNPWYVKRVDTKSILHINS